MTDISYLNKFKFNSKKMERVFIYKKKIILQLKGGTKDSLVDYEKLLMNIFINVKRPTLWIFLMRRKIQYFNYFD